MKIIGTPQPCQALVQFSPLTTHEQLYTILVQTMPIVESQESSDSPRPLSEALVSPQKSISPPFLEQRFDMFRFSFIALMMLSPFTFAPSQAAAQAPGTVVEVAVAAGNFQTLVAAVQAAGLVDVLNGEGPFTVFAPTDEAFARIPEAQLQALLADPAALAAVLTYHVLPGRVSAADVSGLPSATTVNGKDVTFTNGNGEVRVDGARVLATDIQASNGIIHVIDNVILP